VVDVGDRGQGGAGLLQLGKAGAGIGLSIEMMLLKELSNREHVGRVVGF